MHAYTPKITLKFISPLVLAVFFFVFFTLPAHASIVVEGDREFTDDVNNCINTYRGAPGIVGDVIKELENSDNEHKIINSPDWTNTVNDASNAFDGTGTGTVTRVDKQELEKYKKSFPELANKDFCTAILHELWHAVDADRGEWSTDVEDGVKENEIEATMFQNFVHAIRGVDPRTAYGGVDISQHVVIGFDAPEAEEEEEEVKAPEPEPKEKVSVSTDYKHVAPGSYSEIYVYVMTIPSIDVKAKLTGPGVDSAASQTVKSDGKGAAQFTWRIVAYGNYTVSGIAGEESFSSVVNVQ